jgi:hypothetical protein
MYGDRLIDESFIGDGHGSDDGSYKSFSLFVGSTGCVPTLHCV